MLNEVREISYANSVRAVSRNIVSMDVKDYSWHLPHYGHNIDVLRSVMVNGFDTIGYTDSVRSNRVISELKEKVGMNTRYASESIPWVIAAAVITNDEVVQGISDSGLRFLFDAAMEVPREYHDNQYRRAERKAAYELDSERREEYMAHALEHRELAEGWRKHQESLREEASPSGPKERE